MNCEFIIFVLCSRNDESETIKTYHYHYYLYHYHYTVGYVKKVERVQKRAYRMIPNLQHLHYGDQLAESGLLSLRACRIRYHSITMFKMYKKQ